MAIEITSRSNPRIRELLQKKDDLFFFEGEKLVADLLARRIQPEILIQVRAPAASGTKIGFAGKEHWLVSENVMEKLSDLKSVPPVLAVARLPHQKIDWQKADRIAVLDSIQDPANLGSIFRCAAAFGIQGLALSGACVRANHPKLVRSAQTALLDVDFESFPDLPAVIRKARKNRFNVYLTSSHEGSKSLAIDRIRLPAAIVFGSEGSGIADEILRQFPHLTIPQEKRIESLNVGIAACILFHELFKLHRP